MYERTKTSGPLRKSQNARWAAVGAPEKNEYSLLFSEETERRTLDTSNARFYFCSAPARECFLKAHRVASQDGWLIYFL